MSQRHRVFQINFEAGRQLYGIRMIVEICDVNHNILWFSGSLTLLLHNRKGNRNLDCRR